MELGIVLPHTGSWASPAMVRSVAIAAEAAELDALWTIDHIVAPHHTESPYVLGRKPAPVPDGSVAAQMSPNYEMLTTLSWVAGFTERIALGTSVAIAPIRNTLLTGRQLATLDIYSCGRVRYGVGVGWLREEADAMGMPWDRRGARTEEHVALLRAMWTAEGDVVEFHGEFHEVPPMDPEPRPVQRPIPILIGGHSPAALERAGRIGDGWITASMSPERVAELWAVVNHAAEDAGRDPADLTLTVAATPLSADGGPTRAEQMAAYEAIGVDHLQMRLDRSAALEDLERLVAERP